MTSVYIVRSFTQRPDEGNPAGVVLCEHLWSDEDMLRVARSVPASETTFVIPESNSLSDYRLRFFRPDKEIPLCGHGTVAAFHVVQTILNPSRHMVNFRTPSGVLSVQKDGAGVIWMQQGRVAVSPVIHSPRAIADCLGLTPDELSSEWEIVTASTGNPKVICMVSGLDSLGRIQPDVPDIRRYNEAYGVNGIYVFTTQTRHGEHQIHARMVNETEDPVTGSAAGALGGLLVQRGTFAQGDVIVVEQGHFVQMPGLMYVTTVDHSVHVGGHAVFERTVDLA